MISAVVTERLMPGDPCRLEKGTLRLVKVDSASAVFVANAYLEAGEEVWLVPMDGALIVAQQGLPVRGAASASGRSGTGGSTTVIPPSQGGS